MAKPSRNPLPRGRTGEFRPCKGVRKKGVQIFWGGGGTPQGREGRLPQQGPSRRVPSRARAGRHPRAPRSEQAASTLEPKWLHTPHSHNDTHTCATRAPAPQGETEVYRWTYEAHALWAHSGNRANDRAVQTRLPNSDRPSATLRGVAAFPDKNGAARGHAPDTTRQHRRSPSKPRPRHREHGDSTHRCPTAAVYKLRAQQTQDRAHVHPLFV